MKLLIIRYLSILCLVLMACSATKVSSQTTIRIMDTLLFFDGYATTVTTPAPPTGIIRHRNDLFARKLTMQELQSIGTTLQLKVTVKAACDNYDRIGTVNMALIPKGSVTYKPDSVTRIELARFITPFMNKNVKPDSVPYNFTINNVASLLRETSITSVYDIWIELQLFGVPYAANTQVAGCSGRSDVFYGSLAFITNSAAPAESNNILKPLAFQKDLNNYQTGATDTIGKTTKTINFNLTQNLSDAVIFLITSNHGSNSGGEEYNRRNHYVYFDNNLKLTYLPGRISCEPFRQYNTQGNGIYGSSARTDAQWQSFSNWCPGDIISIRQVNLGALTTGNHSFKINVPDAVFTGAQGNFPLSLYLHGKTSGTLAVSGWEQAQNAISLYPNPANQIITLQNKGAANIKSVSISNSMGVIVYQNPSISNTVETLPVEQLAAGMYIVNVTTDMGIAHYKINIVR